MPTMRSQTPASYTPPSSRATQRHALGLRGFAETLNAETDQACAVLAAAFLQASLEELFRARMRVSPAHVVNGLFVTGGPLASLAARVDLARALGWLTDAEHADLHIVRRVGEAFAADVRHELSFSDQRIRTECGRLEHANAFLAEAGLPDSVFSEEVLAELQGNARHRFEMAIGFLRQAVTYRASEPDTRRDSRAGS